MVGTKRKSIRYFYLDKQLHKVLKVSRPQDLVVAWNYPEGARKGYIWSDVKRRMQNAYTVTEVAKMVNRHRMRVDTYIREGLIRTPQRIYTLDERRIPGKYMFSEDDVLELHDFMMTQHRGRPRKDGLVTLKDTPTRAELQALMRSGTMYHIQDSDGKFIPVWKERLW